MPDTTPPGEASIKALVAAAVADLQRLVKAQIALAKLELQQTGRAAGKTGIFLVSALSMAAMGGIFLLVTLAYVLVALGLPVWAGFGIVTLVLFIAGLTTIVQRRSIQIGFLALSAVGLVAGFAVLATTPGAFALG